MMDPYSIEIVGMVVVSLMNIFLKIYCIFNKLN